MDSKRNRMKNIDPQLLLMIDFVKSLGLRVNTGTKARGHQGFFMHNRIDISSVISDERKKEVLVHEFAHYIHHKIEPNVIQNHGSLKVLFQFEDVKILEKELFEVTRFVDRNTALQRLYTKREEALNEIKQLDKQIKLHYPEFKRSYPFKPFDSALKKTDAVYLLKYDRVKVKTGFFKSTQEYSVKTFEKDFPQFNEHIKTYVLLKSQQRLLKRISSRIGRLNRYYKRPSELFARFVQGLYADKSFVGQIAPNAFYQFNKLLNEGYYYELGDFLEILNSH